MLGQAWQEAGALEVTCSPPERGIKHTLQSRPSSGFATDLSDSV